MSLDDFAQHLQVEEQLRQKEITEPIVFPSKIHMMKEKEENKTSEHSFNQKRKFQNKKFVDNKKAKKVNGCYNCGKLGQFERDYPFLKKKPQSIKENFMDVIFEINTIERDDFQWIDSGATKHICNDKSLFKKFEPSQDENYLYMGNSAKTTVKENGTVDLESCPVKF